MASSSGRARALAFLAAATAAIAFAAPANALVVPGDTFSFSVAGFNSASGTGYLLGASQLATFGTTQTYAGAGANGQDYTIRSFETIGATTTTDTFVVSTPANFLTTTTVNGTTITALQFDIGTANSGLSLAGGADPVNFALPIGSYTATGSILYGSGAGSTLTLTPTVSLAGNGLSFTTVEGVNSGTTAISSFAVRQFSFSITYANPVGAVPEPATWAMLIGGFGLTGGVMRRRATPALRTA